MPANEPLKSSVRKASICCDRSAASEKDRSPGDTAVGVTGASPYAAIVWLGAGSARWKSECSKNCEIGGGR